MKAAKSNSAVVRWMKFNAVGALGILVQLGTLLLLTSILGLNYLVATACAVEAAVLHNFFWHQAFTWRDRPSTRLSRRLLKFNLTTGALSIFANLVAMRLLVEMGGLNYTVANLISIAGCSLLNFAVADRAVFVPSTAGRQSM
jgi:putative flippase GtrA